MEFIADLLIAAGAIGVAAFCFVLSRRLKALGRLDSGIGGAIAILAAQVDDLTRALKSAQATARETAKQLESQTRRADAACRKLELLMASLHDLPGPEPTPMRAPRKSPPKSEAQFSAARPLARWNTNRLAAEPEYEADSEDETASRGEPAPIAPIEALDTLGKRPRNRVVRRRHSVGARA